MNKFKIGDKVYTPDSNYRNFIITEIISEFEYEVTGERFVEATYDKEGYWDNFKRNYYDIELKKTPFKETESIYTKDKWYNIVKRNVITTRVNYFYRDVKSGMTNMNPTYQRELVWSLKQKQAYIEALFKEKAKITPTIVLNWSKSNIDVYEVLDGKQRLNCIFDFIDNKFALTNKMKFKDLCIKDCNFLINHDIQYTRIEKHRLEDLTEQEKIEIFLEINELGTKVDKKHIDKVKNLLKE